MVCKHTLGVLIIVLAIAQVCAACNTDWNKAAGAASDLGAVASVSDDELGVGEQRGQHGFRQEQTR